MRTNIPLKKESAEKMFNRKASPDTNLSVGAFLKKSAGGAKAKVIDKVSDVMSYPARRSAQKAMIKADHDVRDIKAVREARGAEPVPNDERSSLFRARANVSFMKSKAQRVALKNSK
jgi:hypothetical protein